MIFSGDSFEGVLSDLRCPGSAGHPAGAAVVRISAGDRKAEIHNMFHTPGTYMPPIGFLVVTCDTHLHFNIFRSRRKVETSIYERDELPTETTRRAANSNGNVEEGCMAR